MKTVLLPCLLAVACLSFSACSSTPDARYAKREAEAASWSPSVRNKVKLGLVEPGFTKDQVWVALGEADRISTRSTADGEFEVWTYLSKAPSFSIGIGGGSGGFGGGVGVGSGGSVESKRVVFKGGVVTSLEEDKRK